MWSVMNRKFTTLSYYDIIQETSDGYLKEKNKTSDGR